MINKTLEQTFATLISDAKFIKKFNENYNYLLSQGTPQERFTTLKEFAAFVLHIIDWNVTMHLLDMEADILRLCEANPYKALEFRTSLNEAAIALKTNYQNFFNDSKEHKDNFNSYKIVYCTLITKSICELNGTISTNTKKHPFEEILDIDYEFIYSNHDEKILQKKLNTATKIEISTESVKEFTDKCFKWSDEIKASLERINLNKTIIAMNLYTLERIHSHCNGYAYNTSFENFAKAIMGSNNPNFHVLHADAFYAALLAIYNSLGCLTPRDNWLKSILNNFGLEQKNYYNAKNRIINNKTPKLSEWYHNIMSIISE